MSGPDSLRGFDYQISYVFLKLIELLSENKIKDILKIQFESLDEEEEDFNIYWKGGQIDFIQVKKRSEGYPWTPSDIKELITHYDKKYNEQSKYIFITNGSANKKVKDLKKSVKLNKILSKSDMKLFTPLDMSTDRMNKLTTTMEINTLFFASNDDDKPSKEIKKEIISKLNSSRFYLSQNVEHVYNILWKKIFDASKDALVLNIEDIKLMFESSGVTIIEKDDWLRIPIVNDFAGRINECNILRKNISKIGNVVVTGISGIGKSYIMAYIAKELIWNDKSVCWISVDSQLQYEKMFLLICKFIESKTNVQGVYEQYKNKDIEDSINVIANIMKENELFLFFDAYEKASDKVEIFINRLFSEDYRGSSSTIVITTTKKKYLYNNIDLELGKVAEVRISEYLYEDIKDYLKDVEGCDEDQRKRIYNTLGGYPIAITLIKRYLKSEYKDRLNFDKLLSLSNEEKNKWIFEKIYSLLSENYKTLISYLATVNYMITEYEIVILENKLKRKIEFDLQVLVNDSILEYDGENYFMHDTIRNLAYDILINETKIEIHKIFAKKYETRMLNFNKGQKEDIPINYKWGYHCEQLNILGSMENDTIKKILDLNNQLISDMWGIWLKKYPLEFNDKSLQTTQERINQLLSFQFIVSENNNKYTLAPIFELKSMFMLEYLIHSRKLSSYYGYIPIFKPNYSFEKQIKVACEWEHCIEYYPLEEERNESSCHIFGHNCPEGRDRVEHCKLHKEEIWRKLN